jgi:hypothetical protein
MIKNMFRIFSIIILSTLLISGCKKEREKSINLESETVDPCKELIDKMDGTYRITVISYPRQHSQEGEEKYFTLFLDPKNCYNSSDTNQISFGGLFDPYSTTNIKLFNNKFIIEYKHGCEWSSAPVKGEGTIINEVFHFTGTIGTSVGEFPIVLDGNRTNPR